MRFGKMRRTRKWLDGQLYRSPQIVEKFPRFSAILVLDQY